MTQFTRAVGKLPFMEIVGIFFAGVGVCFAIAVVGVAFDDNRASDEKPKIQQSVEEMKQKLIAAKVPEEQISGLCWSTRAHLSQQRFISISSLRPSWCY